MSVLWMDDPSFYNTTQFRVKYTTGSGMSVSSGTGRFGTASWEGNGSGATVVYFRKILSSSIATGTLAVSVKLAQLSAYNILSFQDAGSNQIGLAVNGSGNLVVQRNATSTTLATSTNALSTGIWYRIEIQVTIHPSAGSIEVRVNGSSTGWIPSTGSLNTRATSNSTFNEVALGGFLGVNNNCSPDFNDAVLTDNNSPNAGFLGDKRCYLLLPSSDSSVQWTHNTGASNFAAVNNNPADDDTTYNSDSTVSDLDLFGHGSLPGGASNIAAVDNVVYARKDDAGVRTIHNVIKSSTTSVETADFNLSTSYQYIDQIQETDPNTSSAWGASGVNASLIGYKVIA